MSFAFYFLIHFLNFWNYKVLQGHLVYFLPKFWIQTAFHLALENGIFRMIFFSRMALKIKIQELGVLFATEISFLLGPFSWQNKEMHVCILTCSYANIYKYFYMQTPILSKKWVHTNVCNYNPLNGIFFTPIRYQNFPINELKVQSQPQFSAHVSPFAIISVA